MVHRFLPRRCHREKKQGLTGLPDQLGLLLPPSRSPRVHMAVCKSVWHVAQSNPTVFLHQPGELILIYELSRLITFSYFYTHTLFFLICSWYCFDGMTMRPNQPIFCCRQCSFRIQRTVEASGRIQSHPVEERPAASKTSWRLEH